MVQKNGFPFFKKIAINFKNFIWDFFKRIVWFIVFSLRDFTILRELRILFYVVLRGGDEYPDNPEILFKPNRDNAKKTLEHMLTCLEDEANEKTDYEAYVEFKDNKEVRREGEKW